ncbi:MAG: hypothetical protein A2Y50_08640 [Pseudomonadales bacterium RIFCSPLOWO2_12_59_9]|nr:MAG: hypothetical protein A2Y50_08640 [Pseudomonadales bacterium RIFCSPLOWO2_12_59_9]
MHTAVKIQQIAFLKGIAQTEHRHFMLDLAKGTERRTANPLSRRIDSDQRWMLGLQRLQFAEQTVVLGIWNARLVQHVVTVVVPIQLGAQFEDALGGVCGGVGHNDFSQKAKEQPRLLF